MKATFLLLSVLVALACGGESESGSSPDDAAAALSARGQSVYQANCIACHNIDPSKDGAVGPAIAGSSLELLQAKVLRNEYPPGYTPKRTTGSMIPLPHLEKDLPALAAYLGP